MSAPFSFTKELSASQCTAIDRALRAHRITVTDENFDWLCSSVEQALTWYLNLCNWKPSSRAGAFTDIRKLRDALKRLDRRTSGDIISAASSYTLTQKRLDATGKISSLIDAIYEQWSTGAGVTPELSNEISEKDDGRPDYSFYRLAVSMLNEACELALSDTPPKDIFNEQEDIVTMRVAKGGRPEKLDERELTKDLAQAFKTATGHPATDTEYGAFDDFLSVCLEVINLKKEQGTNRKLIRAALYNKPGHVPKPPKTK